MIRVIRVKLKQKEYTKYLVILNDNKLTWTYLIDHVNLKVTEIIGISSKISKCFSKKTSRMLYFAFAQPHINNC